MRRVGERWLFVAGLLAATACGAKSGLQVERRDAARGMDAAMDAAVDAGQDAAVDAGTDGGVDSGPDAGPSCRPFGAEAPLASLDVFVLLDSSGSMADGTLGGVTKAEAVTAALRDFVTSSASSGIGVALTFFPYIDEDVPEHCAEDAECGAGGSCEMPDICYPSGEQYCRTTADCADPGDRCEPLGVCTDDARQGCLPGIWVSCAAGSVCEDFGFCDNQVGCSPADYAPAVPIGQLPEVAPRFVDALEAREPHGGTSTAPALEETFRRARQRRVEHPGSKVIVLLATDGFPTECDPAIDLYGPRDVNAGLPLVVEIVDGAAEAGLETFVVGVFQPEEEEDARANLTAIATAGGTDEALIVTTTEPVADRLLAIFEDLRRSVRTCVYAVPHAGVLPEPEQLQVSLALPAGEELPLELRASPAECDPSTGGFFFEQDVEMGTRPGYAELCPASCSIAARPDVTVQMRVDCED